MKTTRGRRQDARQANRRQLYELEYRARKWNCIKLVVVLCDMLEAEGPSTAHSYLKEARATLRRAEREYAKQRKAKR